MSEKLQALSGGGAKPAGWLDGRAGRREYWIWVAPLTIGNFVFAGAFPALAFVIALPVGLWVFLITIRRFHDIGWSGFAVPIVNVGFTVVVFALNALLGASLGAVVTLLLSVVLLSVVGAWPGQPSANRYGPPPRRGKDKDVAEVFN